MLIVAKTGEAIPIERVVTGPDGSALDLTGASAKFWWAGDADDVHDCTITDNVVSYKIPAANTLTAGTFRYEMRLSISGDPREISSGEIVIYPTQLKNI